MFKKRQNKKILIFKIAITTSVIVLLTILFSLLFSNNNNNFKCFDDEYRSILQEVYPSLSFEKSESNEELCEVLNGESIVTYEHIATQLIDANDDYKFIPQYKETIIIAINRDLTSENIDSFSQLFNSKNDISLFLGDKVALNVWEFEQASHIFASIAFGLYKEYNIKQLAKELDQLQDINKLFINENKPFMIMTDKYAVELMKSGKNIEIVIPSDGTHTFIKGILTNKEITTNKILLESILVEKGYRTIDNKCDNDYYPNNDTYNNSKEVSDISSYYTNVSNAGKIIRRDVFDTKRFGFATNTDRAIFFVILSSLIVIYICLLNYRVKQNNIRNAIKLIGISQLGLMSSFILRLMTLSSVNTLLWYLYYAFFALLSLCFLYIAINVFDYKSSSIKKGLKKYYLIYI